MHLVLLAALAGTARLPADAPVYVAIRPSQLADDVAFLNLAARTQPEIAQAEDRVRDLMHFDPFKKSDWVRIGVDPETPVVMGLFRTDGAEVDRVLRAVEAGKPAPNAAFRHRVVARVGDAAKLKTFLGDLARSPWSKQLKAAIEGDQLVIDVATPYEDGKPATPAPPKALGLATDRGAAKVLGEGAVSTYVVFDRLPLLGTAQGAAAVAAALKQAPAKQRRALGKQGAMEARTCSEFSKTGGALFDDLATSARLGQGAWELHAAWGESALGKLALAMAAADDGLYDATRRSDAMVVGQVFLNGVSLVRAVQRMGMMRDLNYATEHIRLCGGMGYVIAGLRYWPQGAAFALDEAAKDGEMGPLVAAARNLAFVVRGIQPRSFDVDGVVAASLDLPAGSPAEKAACKSPQKLKKAGREVLICQPQSGSKERVAWDSLPGGQRVVAYAPEQKALDWWFGLPRPAPRPHPAELAILHVDVARLMAAVLKDADPMMRAAAGMLASGRTRAIGTVRQDGDLLRADLRVDSAQK